MPFKFHEPRRHRVPKARYRVTNWPDYDRGLVGRGDLRLWITDEALAAWAAPRRRTRGGQARFSDLAIETVLVLASVFRLPLRQAEGFARSILAVMGLELPVPVSADRILPRSWSAPLGPDSFRLNRTGFPGDPDFWNDGVDDEQGTGSKALPAELREPEAQHGSPRITPHRRPAAARPR
jgi:hypothetical protein